MGWGFGEVEDEGGVVDGDAAGVDGVGDVGEVLQSAGEGENFVGFAWREQGGGGEPAGGSGEAEFLAGDAGVDLGDESDPAGFQQLDLVGDRGGVGEELILAQLPDLGRHDSNCIELVFESQ